MTRSPVRRTLLISLPIGIVLGATGALAGMSLLDEAEEHVGKAESALQRADDPKKQGEFGGHRKKALDALGEARREIKKAKEFVGGPSDPKPPGLPPTPIPKPEPTSSGGPKKPPLPPVPPKKPEPEPPKKPPAKPPEGPPSPPKK